MTLVFDDELSTKEKERHLKRLLDLSEKSLGKMPQLDEPNEEQKQWIRKKSWRSPQ
jgi:hypothetical protein